MIFKILVAGFLGLAGGLAVGSGLVAFLTILGIVPRLMQLTKTFHFIRYYEWAIIIGVICSSLLGFLGVNFHLPQLLIAGIGLFCGLFVGMLAAALTEVLNVLPILAKRIGVEHRIAQLLIALVIGKICGSLFHWVYFVMH